MAFMRHFWLLHTFALLLLHLLTLGAFDCYRRLWVQVTTQDFTKMHFESLQMINIY